MNLTQSQKGKKKLRKSLCRQKIAFNEWNQISYFIVYFVQTRYHMAEKKNKEKFRTNTLSLNVNFGCGFIKGNNHFHQNEIYEMFIPLACTDEIRGIVCLYKSKFQLLKLDSCVTSNIRKQQFFVYRAVCVQFFI